MCLISRCTLTLFTYIFFFFFFQAEDGIRDYKVTGVQTCALPILCQRDVARRQREGTVCIGPRLPPAAQHETGAGSNPHAPDRTGVEVQRLVEMRERGIKATESHFGNGGAAQEVRVCGRSFQSHPVCLERAEQIVRHLLLVDADRELHVGAPRGERLRTLHRDTGRPGVGGEITQHAVSECARLREASPSEREGAVDGDGLLVVADGPPQAGQVERVAPLRGRLALQESVVCREARGRSLGKRLLRGWREGEL